MDISNNESIALSRAGDAESEAEGNTDAQNSTTNGTDRPTTSSSTTTIKGRGNGDSVQKAQPENRRRSGRVVKKPIRLSPSPNIPTSSKRKRAQVERDNEDEEMADASENESNGGENDEEGEDDEEEESEEEEEDDGNDSPADEEVREKKRKSAKNGTGARGRSKKTPTTKPATKRARTASGAVPRPTTARKAKKSTATNGAAPKTPAGKKSKSKAKNDNAAVVEDNASDALFEKIIEADNIDVVANQWTLSYEEDELDAMRQLVNVFLRCCGCSRSVTNYDIEDQDSAAATLSQIQEAFQKEQSADYPLISKRPEYRGFRKTMFDFIQSLINHITARELLYTDVALIENIQVWITAMSSSSLRPFRHTATVISLNIVTTLCDVAAELRKSIATTTRQAEAEKNKSKKNQGRIKGLEAKLKEVDERKELVEGVISDIFNAVFVNRYRDIDPKIRTDCVHDLATWVLKLPDVFFDGTYVRYLGWVLSDTSPHTRLEVIKSLSRIFKNKENVAGMRNFTEKFRPRLVEMATRDADSNVRALTVELLNVVREVGYLEPDDVDTVGRLLFDSDARVRKAVVGFFVKNLEDIYQEKIDELGGQEVVDEGMAGIDEADEDYDGPRVSWVKLKCLVEVLASYDEDSDEGGESGAESQGPGDKLGSVVREGEVQSRFSLAGMALWERCPDVRDWEGLAKYLLYDHSAPQLDEDDADNDDGTIEEQIKRFCVLDAKEETILLQMLYASVVATILAGEDPAGHGKKTAHHKTTPTATDSISRSLAKIIPPLLKRFGPTPDAASTVLRLEQLTNLDVYQQLRQTTAYASLLDDINRQFLSHADESVLKEASAALLHAKTFEELDEVTGEKLNHLQEETIAMLMGAVRGKGKGKGESVATAKFSDGSLTDLINTVRRLEYLASITDCREMLETAPAAVTTTSSKGRSSSTANKDATGETIPIKILLALLSRGTSVDELEEELIVRVLKTLLFYFMWKVKALSDEVPEGISEVDIEDLQDRRQEMIDAVARIVTSRTAAPSADADEVEPPRKVDGMDAVKVAAAGTILDMYTLFGTLKHRLNPDSTLDPSSALSRLTNTISNTIPAPLQNALLKTFIRAQKTYAKAAKRTLEPPSSSNSNSPSPSPEPPSEKEGSDDEDDEEEVEEATVLMYEQRLCELTSKLVLAILSDVVDKKRFKKYILRNKTRLGQNMKEVLGHLENLEIDKKPVAAGASAKGKKGPAAVGKKPGTVGPSGTRKGTRARAKTLSKDDVDSDEENSGPEPELEDRIVVAGTADVEEVEEQEEEEEEEEEVEEDEMEAEPPENQGQEQGLSDDDEEEEGDGEGSGHAGDEDEEMMDAD